MRAARVSEAFRDAFHLDRRGIQFARVDRHDLNSSMNCAEQQKTVGLRATRSKALESGSKLQGFQYCEARAGQAPPLRVASAPAWIRRLIALVQYPTTHAKSNPAWLLSRRASPVHGVGQVLGEVLYPQLRFRALGGNPVAEHRQAEGTGRRHARRLGPQRLLDAVVVDARPDLLLHPHAAA